MRFESICVSICADTADEMIRRASAAAPDADVVELRIDCLGPDGIVDIVAKLTSDFSFPKPLLITRRPVEQGGHWQASREQRLEWWSEMHRRIKPDGIRLFFDIELDINAALHAHSQGHVISFHDFSGVPDAIDILFEEMYAGDANAKIAWAASDICDTIPAWQLLETARETNRWLTPVAMGECGKWTRILGPSLGARMTYASPGDDDGTAPGQISARDLKTVYRVNQLDEETDVFALIAGDTSYSLSPILHNANFAQCGINSVFVPMQVADLDSFMRRMVLPQTRETALRFRGFAVTNPHKTDFMRYLDGIDADAEAIGAVNTVKVEDGRLLGSNTDAKGFLMPLLRTVADLASSRAAVIGTGGAARACIHALKGAGCDVTVFGRDEAKAEALAEEFKVRARSLKSALLKGHDIVVNATPLGTRGKSEGETPVTAEGMSGVKIAYDLVYNPSSTLFLREAAAAGAMTIGGIDMLVEQAALQQSVWTGPEPDRTAMRRAVDGLVL